MPARNSGLCAASVCLALLCSVPASAQVITGTPGSPSATTTLKGNQLPAPPPPFGGTITHAATSSTPWWAPTVVPPKGAPNVLLIMTDDQGYGVSGTFGGVIPTPAMDRIAKAGLRYTQFHSTALCSPTRAALVTGRNHHSIGFGVIGELSTGFPGYNSIIPKDEASVGKILLENGYATSWFGKNHNTPSFQYSSAAGPFDQWPSGQGFEYFYGFMGGETDQWTPYLFRNHTAVYPWIGKPGYNLITDLADDAIRYMRELNSAAPDKPFFIHYVPGGTHAPHQPTQEWIDKFKGKFDMGWNAMRDSIFANQKRLGVIPANAKLTPWPDDLPSWDSVPEAKKKLFARQAEVFGAYVAYTDHEIGRVIQEVENEGKLDNTLIIYISGDNGTSAEGTLDGTYNSYTAYNGVADVPMPLQLLHYRDWGSDKTGPNMAVMWAWAFDTPFKWTKQVASHFGGTRQGMVMSWPGHITDVGGVRSQFHHVIDIVPTILEAAGIPQPDQVDGIKQRPIEGISMAYTWPKANADSPSKRETQYFEMVGNRAIYHDGWIAATTPPQPSWLMGTGVFPAVDDYHWELYHIAEDYSEDNDLAAAMPDKLKEMQAIFMAEAAKYQVFPLDNSGFARILTARPSATAGRDEFVYTGVNPNIPTGSAPNILDRDFTITADVTVPKGGGEGVIVTEGGRFGGYALYLSRSFNWWYHEALFRRIALAVLAIGLLLSWRAPATSRAGRVLTGTGAVLVIFVFATGLLGLGKSKPVFTYNLLDLERTSWTGSALGAGKHTVVFDFKYNGPGPGKGGTGVLTVDGKETDRKELKHTVPLFFTISETFDVGDDLRTGVDDLAYQLPFAFTGTVDTLKIKVGPAQMSEPEQQAAAAAMAKANN